MPKLTQLIGLQGFELIGARITSILQDEFDGQYAISGLELFDLEIYRERNITPFDKTELPAINVSLSRGTYEDKAVISENGVYLYNIDVYVNEVTTGVEQLADEKSAIHLQRLLGVCRSIMQSSIYKTLGFAPNFISWVKNVDINIGETSNVDGLTTSMGRLIIQVKCIETAENTVPVTATGYETLLKLDSTNLGYDYSIIV